MSIDLPATAARARELAAHLRRHFPVQDEPPPALGDPGLPAQFELIRLYVEMAQHLRGADRVLDQIPPMAVEAVQKLWEAHAELGMLYGLPAPPDMTFQCPSFSSPSSSSCASTGAIASVHWSGLVKYPSSFTSTVVPAISLVGMVLSP